MKKIGIVLLVFQGAAVLGSLAQDVSGGRSMGTTLLLILQGAGGEGVGQGVGYFLPGIVGAVLVLWDKLKKK